MITVSSEIEKSTTVKRKVNVTPSQSSVSSYEVPVSPAAALVAFIVMVEDSTVNQSSQASDPGWEITVPAGRARTHS